MRLDFEQVKDLVDIESVAVYLMGESTRGGMFRHPNEGTASVKIYPESQSFYDFGRGIGGDAISLWAHVKNISNWDALKELCALYGISMTDSNESTREQIKQQEMAQKARRDEEKQRKRRWVREVDKLKAEVEKYDALMTSEHIPKTSDVYKWCLEFKQSADHRLDILCGICD